MFLLSLLLLPLLAWFLTRVFACLLVPLDVWLALAGVLSLDELRQGLDCFELTSEQIDQLSFELDTDKDGKVLLKRVVSPL